ncbi:MAG: hypothetical protein RLO52_01410 [Sandaracinaceae bacterium]
MNSLLPCPACQRHVRAAESLCPFCGETLPMSLRSRVASRAAVPVRRLGRAATFAFGAALAASTASACGGEVGDEDSGVANDSGTSPSDGGASSDAGSGQDSGTSSDSGTEADSGIEADSGVTPEDGGGIAPAYGGPTPVDAGPSRPDAGRRDAGGGVMPLYGGPPPSE